MSKTLAVIATLGATGLLAACGDDDADSSSAEAATGGLTVSAASSLTDAFETYGDEFPGDEKFQFAGSDDLAAQIRQGAPVDVFASANTTYPGELYDEGLVEDPRVFARNQLVIAAPADSLLGDTGDPAESALNDMEQPGFDLVIGAKGVPAGDYAREVLGRLPADQEEAILRNVRSEESEVKGIVAKLVTGAADAGFVYATDVVAAGEDLRAIELPADLRPEVAYGVAVVADSENKEAAEDFIAGLLDGEGAQALLDAGFLAPPSSGGD